MRPARLFRRPMRIMLVLLAIVVGIVAASPGIAQTSGVRDTATAYGARLTAKGLPAAYNRPRINNRIVNRIDTRLGLRIERYRVDSSSDPTATLRGQPDDGTRTTPVIAPPPPVEVD